MKKSVCKRSGCGSARAGFYLNVYSSGELVIYLLWTRKVDDLHKLS